MRVSIHTLGTRGDIQPYLALARGLIDAGHEVSLAAPRQFESWIHSLNVPFHALPGEFLDLLNTPEGKAAVAGGSGGFGAGFKLLKHVKPLMNQLFSEEWAASRDFNPDLIVYHPKALAAPHIAEHLKRPAILASPLPGFTPTREFASPLLPFRSLGPLNRLSHSLMANLGEQLFKRTIHNWRRETLGTEPNRVRAPTPYRTIYAYSPTVVPRPADWADDVLVSGYWFLDEQADWQPSAELAQFLSEGPPPVYVGFGSMPSADPVAQTSLVLEALAMSNHRGLLVSGGGAFDRSRLPPSVHVLESAPHAQLFPRVQAVVHHGGAGTTAAGLRAGKPSVICPFFGDQPFWGDRAMELGAAPPPIAHKKLTAAKLANSIREATENPSYREAAEKLAESIRKEEGVASAIHFIERTRTSPCGFVY